MLKAFSFYSLSTAYKNLSLVPRGSKWEAIRHSKWNFFLRFRFTSTRRNNDPHSVIANGVKQSVAYMMSSVVVERSNLLNEWIASSCLVAMTGCRLGLLPPFPFHSNSSQ